MQWLARRYACILTWPIRIKRCFQSQSGAVQAKTHPLPVIFSALRPIAVFHRKATIGSIDSWEEIALVFLVQITRHKQYYGTARYKVEEIFCYRNLSVRPKNHDYFTRESNDCFFVRCFCCYCFSQSAFLRKNWTRKKAGNFSMVNATS